MNRLGRKKLGLFPRMEKLDYYSELEKSLIVEFELKTIDHYVPSFILLIGKQI